MSTCSTHPLLLPALIYSAYCSKLRYQLLQVRDQIDTVQEETGQVLKMSASGKEPTAQSENASQNTYESLHKTLVEQHARLTNGLSDFIAELGPACEKALSTIEVADPHISVIGKTAAHVDVKLFVSILLTAARFDWQNRERLLGRVSIQLQVVRTRNVVLHHVQSTNGVFSQLYNLMQQKISNQAMHESALMKDIANLTLRDSSAMKSIALLTMIFLPSTAVAVSTFMLSSHNIANLLTHLPEYLQYLKLFPSQCRRIRAPRFGSILDLLDCFSSYYFRSGNDMGYLDTEERDNELCCGMERETTRKSGFEATARLRERSLKDNELQEPLESMLVAPLSQQGSCQRSTDVIPHLYILGLGAKLLSSVEVCIKP